jgi:hypothetical protein
MYMATAAKLRMLTTHHIALPFRCSVPYNNLTNPSAHPPTTPFARQDWTNGRRYGHCGWCYCSAIATSQPCNPAVPLSGSADQPQCMLQCMG